MLSEEGDINLFLNKTIQEMIGYLWDESKEYFHYDVFPKFLFFNLIPVSLIQLPALHLAILGEEVTQVNVHVCVAFTVLLICFLCVGIYHFLKDEKV